MPAFLLPERNRKYTYRRRRLEQACRTPPQDSFDRDPENYNRSCTCLHETRRALQRMTHPYTIKEKASGVANSQPPIFNRRQPGRRTNDQAIRTADQIVGQSRTNGQDFLTTGKAPIERQDNNDLADYE
jgi:hypothetical protein